MLTPERINSLENRIAVARRQVEVYEAHIEPFILQQEQKLFEAFCGVSAQDAEQLRIIKMQQTALRSLKNSFLHFRDELKVAQSELNQSGE